MFYVAYYAFKMVIIHLKCLAQKSMSAAFPSAAVAVAGLFLMGLAARGANKYPTAQLRYLHSVHHRLLAFTQSTGFGFHG
jgi:hypothetical protein